MVIASTSMYLSAFPACTKRMRWLSEDRAGVGLLPHQRGTVGIESGDLDPIHIHIDQTPVGILREGQGELRAREQHRGVVPNSVGVAQRVVGRSGTRVDGPARQVLPGGMGIIVAARCHRCPKDLERIDVDDVCQKFCRCGASYCFWQMRGKGNEKEARVVSESTPVLAAQADL